MRAKPRMNKPQAEAGEMCPLWRKDVSKVCHTCKWYIHVRGKDPQSEQEIDWFDCAHAWGPTLMLEQAQQQRQTGAAVESFRNGLVPGMTRIAHALQAATEVTASVPHLPSED